MSDMRDDRLTYAPMKQDAIDALKAIQQFIKDRKGKSSGYQQFQLEQLNERINKVQDVMHGTISFDGEKGANGEEPTFGEAVAMRSKDVVAILKDVDSICHMRKNSLWDKFINFFRSVPKETNTTKAFKQALGDIKEQMETHVTPEANDEQESTPQIG